MAKIHVSRVIERLERSLVELPDSCCDGKTEKVINDMRIILDFMGEQKLGKRSRLDYFIIDIVDMVHEALNVKDELSISAKISPLERWVGEVKIRLLKFGLNGAATRSESVDDNDANSVVGLEKDVKLLLSTAILNEERGLQTSAIKGMIGVGKTTLARIVYNHADVRGRFERRVWVRVSGELSHKEVLVKLVQEVVGCEEIERDSLLMRKMEYADNRTLREMLHKHLQGMRYLIVLDDWQEEMCLRSIIKGLPHEDNGSRLLLTRRSHYIEETIYYDHVMKYLDSAKSWRLFLDTLFGGNKFTTEHKFPKHLEGRGKQLLSDCGGLPLAIKHVGRQLAEKRRLGSEWEQVLESIDLSAILEILESCYQKLKPLVKSCFLHLAFFKEKTTVRAKKLMQLIWAARGMSTLEEINDGYSYLQQLVNESIIEVMDYPIKSFRVNALLHKLSNKKAEEVIGFEMVRSNGNNRSSQSPRHRAIYCSRDEFSYSTDQDKHLVSLFFRGGGRLDASPSYWKSFEQLEILDLDDFGVKVLPESIGSLMGLRYLGLRNNYIRELPDSLRYLKKLEVLDIALNCMMEVPDIIWEMGNLHHLYMSNVICRKPLKIDALRNLETLIYISFDDWTYELSRLRRMARLRNLGIDEVDGNSNVNKLFASLSKMKRLGYLILKGFRFKSMPSLDEIGIIRHLHTLKLDGRLSRLPSADDFPQKICYLKLVDSSLDEDPMPVLEKLPKLKYLKLRNAYTGQEMVILPNCFLELKTMCIEESWNLISVQIGKGAMPRLEKLEIKNSPYLESLPEEIGSIASLEELKMVTTKKVATKIKESGLTSKITIVDMLEL